MNKYLKLATAALISIIVSFSACGKKQSESAANSGTSETAKVETALIGGTENSALNELVKKLPADTLAYAVLDLDNPKYQNFLKSDYAKAGNFFQNIGNKLNSQATGSPLEFIDSLANTLFNKASTSPLNINIQGAERVSQYVFFISGNSFQDLVFSTFAYAKDDQFFANNFEKIQADLKAPGAPTDAALEKTEETSPAEFTKSLAIPNTNSRINLLAKDHYLALSTSKTIASRLFSDLPETEQFNVNQTIKPALLTGLSADPIYYGFANLERVVQLAPQLGLINVKYKPLLNLIPRQVLFSSDFDQAPSTTANFYLPEAELPQNLKGIFTTPTNNAWGVLGTNTFLAFNLNLDFIKKVLGYVKADILNPEDHKKIKQLTDLESFLTDNGSLGLALANYNITGFPDLQLTLPINNAAEKVSFLKGLVSGPATPKGIPQMQWQQTTIAEQPVDYVVSPFGIGLYVNTEGNQVRIGTSEVALQQLIKPTTLLADSFNPAIKFNQNSVLMSFYLDYAKLYRVAQSFKGMMAMFIPPDQGSEVQDAFAQLEKIKNLGTLFVDTSYQNDVIQARAMLQPTTAPQQP